MPLSGLDSEYAYSIDGTVFAGDGCGGYYAQLSDETVGYVNFSEDECGRVSDSIQELLELELNCAYSWHNYLNMRFMNDSALLKEKAPSLEAEGQKQFEEAYGDEMPGYAELQKEIAEKLNLNTSGDIAADILPKLYRTVQKQPEFTAISKTDNTPLGKLYT